MHFLKDIPVHEMQKLKKGRRKERRVKKGKKSGRRKEERKKKGKKSGRRKEEKKEGK